MSQFKIRIGIDPGASTGIAIWDRSIKGFRDLKTKSFWEAIFYIQGIKDDLDGKIDHIMLHIEDPNENSPVFRNKGETESIKEALTFGNIDKAYKQIDSVFRVFGRRAQNVGMNKQMARFMIEYFERIGFKITTVRPTKSKMDAKKFKMFTGYEGRCSQHARDSALLVLGL